MSLQVSNTDNSLIPSFWTDEQKNIIKNMLCPNITDDELLLFGQVCQRSGLDPFCKQIYAIKRKSKDNGYTMTIQTGIDGFRAVADRTGNYCPGKDPEYLFDKDGRLIAAKSYVKKKTKDGIWHDVSATAHFDEYVQTYNGNPSGLWAKMPRAMLSKCAEALAIKRCFPSQLSGIYTDEEMLQADTVDIPSSSVQTLSAEPVVEVREKFPTKDQISLLNLILKKCSPQFVESEKSTFKYESFQKMPLSEFEYLMARAKENASTEVK